MDIVEAPVPLPSAPAVKLADNITLQPPLSRRGNGPGLIILVPEFNISPEEASKTLDPLPLQKWAEEGYAVVEIKCSALGTWDFAQALNKSLESLHALAECDEKEKFGFIDYTTSSDSQVSQSVASSPKIVCAVSYGAFQAQNKQHALLHLTGQNEVNVENRELYTSYQYPEAKSASFIIPGHKDFSPSLSVVAHTRTLTFLKKHIGGPIFDLEAIWNEHTAFEFENRSVANTMGTMVQEPYVNHIPTMTGGIGRTKLSDFYRRHFIFNNPDDTSLELVSRTIGVDRVIDEFIMNFTHETVIDWLVPGIPPTGKKVRVAMTSVVNVRGDRLYHEHIAWDQASVLVQLGLMPEYLPYPYPLPDGRTPAPGKKFEYRVPAAGVETAMKLVDENSVPSNGMFEFQVREVDI